MHYLNRSKSRKGIVTYNIDLEKAYDKVDWRFLRLMPEDFEFPQETIQLIMFCDSSSSISIL